MPEQEMFTRTVNFRMVACELRKSYSQVPAMSEVLDAAYRAGGQSLKDWAFQQAAVNEGAFFSSLSFQMQEAGDAA